MKEDYLHILVPLPETRKMSLWLVLMELHLSQIEPLNEFFQKTYFLPGFRGEPLVTTTEPDFSLPIFDHMEPLFKAPGEHETVATAFHQAGVDFRSKYPDYSF